MRGRALTPDFGLHLKGRVNREKSWNTCGAREDFPRRSDRQHQRARRRRRGRRVRQGRRSAPRRASLLRPDHRPHLARSALLPRLPQARRHRRHGRHQQPLLVVCRRQVLQLLARHEARRRHPEYSAAPAEGLHGGHHGRVASQPRIPARLAGDSGLRGLPRLHQAVRRRRLEERL